MASFVNRSVESGDLCRPECSEDATLPKVGEGIQIAARDGLFVVLGTDVDRGTVDVLRMSGIRRIETGVPLGSVRVLKGLNPFDQQRKFAD